MKGDLEKQKNLEALWGDLNLFCFQKLNKWSSSIITSVTLSGIASLFFFLSVCWVWLRIVTLPSRGYFYLNSCCCLRYLPQNVCFIVYLRPRCVDSHNVLAIDLQVHELFLVCIGERERAPEHVSQDFCGLKSACFVIIVLAVFLTSCCQRRKLSSLNHEKYQWVFSQSADCSLSLYALPLSFLSPLLISPSLPPSFFLPPSHSPSLCFSLSQYCLVSLMQKLLQCVCVLPKFGSILFQAN